MPEGSCAAPHFGQALITKPHALGRWELFNVCMDREVLLVKRNLFLYGFRFFQTMLVGVVTATLFLRTWLHPTNATNVSLVQIDLYPQREFLAEPCNVQDLDVRLHNPPVPPMLACLPSLASAS
jgi:hypothetical protein